MRSYLQALRSSFTLAGRATRREVLVFYVVNAGVVFALMQVDVLLGWLFLDGAFGLISSLFLLAVLIPSATLAVRRLHDSGRSWPWLLPALVPFPGLFVVAWVLLLPGESGDNSFGPDPRPQPVVSFPDDGGPPFASQKRRFVVCPWCRRTNPVGRETCQWCRKPYREEGDCGPV